MAVDKPGDRLVFNTRERLLSSDLNSMQKLLRWDFTSFFGHLFTNVFGTGGATEYGRVLSGLKVQATDPVSNQITVKKGIALVYGSDNDGGEAGDAAWNAWSVVPVYADVNLTVSPNSSGNPRIDIVLLKCDRENKELETKDIFNTVTRLFVPTISTPKRYRTAADATNEFVYIKEGTPAGSPAQPSVDSGTILLGRISVADGFVTIATGVLRDKRTPLKPPRWRGRILGSTGAVQWYSSEGGAEVTFDSNATGVFVFTYSGLSKSSAASGPPIASVKVTPYMETGEDPLSYYVVALEEDKVQIEFYWWNEGTVSWDLADPLSFDLEVEDYGSSLTNETHIGSGLAF